MTYLAMDNFKFIMTGYGSVAMNAALSCLAFKYPKIAAWEKGTDASGDYLWFLWSPDSNPASQELIVPISPTSMCPLIEAWLAGAKYPSEPDHDGSNSRGWRISTEGRAGNWQRAFCIRPEWAEHGK